MASELNVGTLKASKINAGATANGSQVFNARESGNSRVGIGVNASYGASLYGPHDATNPIQLGTISTSDGSTFAAKLTISAAGLCSFANGIEITTGGIQFPAVHSPTGYANNLDDYEVGVHTPLTLVPGTSGTITVSNDALAYTKVGRLVTVTGSTDVASVGTGGDAPVGTYVKLSLPFECGEFTDNGERVGTTALYWSLSGGLVTKPLRVDAGNSYARIWFDVSTIVASDEFYISFSYFV